MKSFGHNSLSSRQRANLQTAAESGARHQVRSQEAAVEGKPEHGEAQTGAEHVARPGSARLVGLPGREKNPRYSAELQHHEFLGPHHGVWREEIACLKEPHTRPSSLSSNVVRGDRDTHSLVVEC